ncbi:MAG: hypothetical protein WC919_04015 [Candidatus Paceibacterota bacterium]|jgi:hypothetical protein
MDAYDVKNILFDALKKALLASSETPSNLTVVAAFDVSATAFPRVVFQELSIATSSRTLDYDNYDKKLMYQVDIFSKASAAETELRRIAKIVNTILEGTFHLVQRASGNITSVDTLSKRYVMTYIGNFDETRGVFH